MECPFCHEDHDKVIDSRSADQGRTIRRRRECLACDRRFTTYERVEETVKLMVIKKKDGLRVPYDRQKLSNGLQKALYKRPVSVEQLQELIETIEDELFRTYEKEVESTEIGRIASDHLKHVDQVAYVRFASVYKEFRDLDDLLEEVREMIAAKAHLDAPGQGQLF